ncbi:peptidase S1 [Nibricoccus aquaticus]|uniref:Peptidase S1 n=1 Tax=Nibricoccus aquaticus TaxID=2576891 RepID=A0A290QFS2_9BACT|nr:DegQ family serine endoprotease [Nibricoccus aquaticus]ATC66090.1 peptidase S1 [Nibricoccus aquaticus]
MNSTSSPSFSSRRKVWSTAGLVAASGLTLSVVAWAAGDQGKQQVSVKIDEQPLARSGVGESASYSPVIKQVAPSVVSVKVIARGKEISAEELPPFLTDPRFRQFFGTPYGLDEGQGNQGRRQGQGRQLPRRPDQQGEGSGVVVSADGYILTNNHVVNGADEIKVSFNDGRELTAKVVGTDPKSDLAVIKVDAKDLQAVVFTDSDKIEVGDKVLAIGNPFGLSQTVTSGMVSALGRATMGLDYEDFIQTDAAINPGNSGGALIDVKGRLVGINTAIYSRSGGFQGIGFAIPANLARTVMEQLVANGKVVRGYLGVTMQPIDAGLAEQFSLKSKEGVIVAEVVQGSPAAKAGLESGDVITKFQGKDVKDARALKFSVANIAPGTKVAVEVLRQGKTEKLELKVGEQPKDMALAARGGATKSEGTLNGVGVADIEPAARREFGISSRVQGALVTEVEPTSAAAAAGLQPGDVIQEINREPVRTAEDAVKLTESNESKKTLLRVWNRQGTRFVVVDETESS